jgi:hypothetical protein
MVRVSSAKMALFGAQGQVVGICSDCEDAQKVGAGVQARL